jgi:hypothetical protein
LSKDLSRYHHRDGHENSKDIQRRIDENRKTMGTAYILYVKYITAEKYQQKNISYSIYLVHLSNSISPLEP